MTSEQMTRDRKVRFLGLDFDDLSMDEAADEIIETANSNLPFRYVVTPNVHHMVKLNELGYELEPKFRKAWRIFCDSRILSGIAKACGCNLPVVPGSDLTSRVISRASARGMSIAVVGPTARDCAILGRRFPGLRLHSYEPPMNFASSETEIAKCIDFIVQSESDLTFIAVGMPQQETLAFKLSTDGRARGVALCIGASIDFLTGKQVRAPRWVQLSHLEWAYRLAGNPKRLARRYLLECPRIFPLVISHLMASRHR